MFFLKTIFLFILLFSCSNNSSSNDNYKCLVKGVNIITPNRIVKIENLKIGDSMLSFENNFFTTNKIVKIIKSKSTKKVFKVTFENLNDNIISANEKFAQIQSISATEDHLFFVVNKNKYKKVLNLKVGDTLLKYKNQKVKVIEKKQINYNNTVYDISLKDEPHNYFANGILVHNKSYPSQYYEYGRIEILNNSKNIKKCVEFSLDADNQEIIVFGVVSEEEEFKKKSLEFVKFYKDFTYNDYENTNFYQQNKKNNDFSSLDVIKLPIKFYDENNNFVFQITNKISKICNPIFDDNEKIIKGTITIDEAFINNPVNGTKSEN